MNTNSCIITADATDPENQRGDDNDHDNDNMKSFAPTCDGMDAGTGTGTGTALASTNPRTRAEVVTPIVAATSIGIDKPNNSNDKAFLSSGNSIHSSSMSSLTCTSSLSSMTLPSSLSVSLSSMSSSSSSSSLPWSTSTATSISTSSTSSSRARELLDSMKARRECLRHAVHANDESTTMTRTTTTTASSPARHLSLLGSQSLQPQPLEPTTTTATSSPTVLLLAQQQMQQSLLGRRNMLLRMARRQSENEHRLLHSNVYVSQGYGLEHGQGQKFSRSVEADKNNCKANPALSANNMSNKQGHEHEREASSSTASLTEESSLSPPSSPPHSPSSSKSVSSSSTTTSPKIIFQSRVPQLDLHAASAEEASETSDAWRPALVSTIASLASLDSNDLDLDSRQPMAAVEVNQSGGINYTVKSPFRLMQWNDLDLPSPLLLQSTQSNSSNKQLQLPSLSTAAPTSESSSLTSSPQTSATGTSTTTQRSAYLDDLYRPSDKALSPRTRPLRRSTRGYRRPRNERVPAAALQTSSPKSASSPKSTPSQTPPHSSPGASTHSTRNKHEEAVSLLSNPTMRRALLQRLLFEQQQQQQQQQEAVANNHDPDLQWRPPIMVSSAHAEIVRALLICTASSSNKGLVNGDDQEDYEFVEDNDGSIDNDDDYEGTLLNRELGDDDDDSFDCTTDSNTSGWISQTDDDLEGGDIGSGTDSSLIDLDDTDEFTGDFWDDTLPVNDIDQTSEIVTDASASSCMELTLMGSLVQHNAGNEKDNDNDDDDDAPVSATNETTCDDVELATANAVAVTDPIVPGHGIEKLDVVEYGLHSQQHQEDETALSNDEPGKTEMSSTDASDHVNDDANVAVTGHSAIQMLSPTPDIHDTDDEIHSDTPFAHGERLETVYETLDECSEDGGDEPCLDENIVVLECEMLNDVWVTSNNALKGIVDDDDFAASYEDKNECFLQDEATAGSTESSSSSLSSTQSDECAIETGCDLMDASDVCGIYPIQWSIDPSKSDQGENVVAKQDDEEESHGYEGIDKMFEHRADLDACEHDLRMMSCTSVHSDDTVDDWKHKRKPKSGQTESSEVEEELDPKIEMDFNVPCDSVTDIIDKELEMEVAVPGSVEVVANALFVEENASDRMCKAAGGTFYLAVLSPGWIDARSCRIKDPASPSKQVLRLSNDFLCGANGSLYNIALRSGCTIQIPEEQIQRRYVKRRRRRQRSSTTSTTSSVSSGGRGGTYYLCTRSGLTKQVMRSCQPYEVTVHVRPRSESSKARILPEDETDALCGAKGSLYMLGKSYS